MIETSVNGLKMPVVGFPHSRQNRESMTCAETSLWGLMEYFSESYSFYKSVLPSDIINKLYQFSDEKLLPSEGHNAQQVAFTLKDFEFGSKSYSQKSFRDLSDTMLTYIESGIPFIVILDNHDSLVMDEDPIAHAIVIYGKEKIDVEIANWQIGEDGMYHIEDIERKVLVMDDNHSFLKDLILMYGFF